MMLTNNELQTMVWLYLEKQVLNLFIYLFILFYLPH